MKKTIIAVFSIIFLFSCNQETNSNKDDYSNTETKHSEQNDIEAEIDNDFGPPFSDSCYSTFDYIGKIRMSDTRFDLILSGNKWNPEYYSCTYIWGELINNEFPPDTLVKDFRIHLLEVDSLPKNLDSTFFNTEIFKTKLIATYSKDKNEKYMTCKFDPNKTGKYPKPKQWVE